MHSLTSLRVFAIYAHRWLIETFLLLAMDKKKFSSQWCSFSTAYRSMCSVSHVHAAYLHAAYMTLQAVQVFVLYVKPFHNEAKQCNTTKHLALAALPNHDVYNVDLHMQHNTKSCAFMFIMRLLSFCKGQ